ncbi:hypothetical protein SAICODRAFT_4574 [Saitoella complicata NRRL Y-17804]|uniref:uncharacterized protein n=1 Tax=Saitoella complicata (strain BCRC 22490 / CBS 7301 / JCM 7358 / NBRC 10748 / NRRL Y-17804) TaxID=698492 RepID=UPI000867B62F|nr:uncharacterized protein SAICODRAFT_4574 [Saitoella complicata NRRL Y-17804]ODQ56393.1 hypothetical protein SAICODRAFT_4574 [Saitoella complicata NRRL Y-17804]
MPGAARAANIIWPWADYEYRSVNLVDSPSIVSASLHNPLPRLSHAYITPFLAVYPTYIYFRLNRDWSPELNFVILGSIITLQSLVWLSGHWSVKIKARTTATKAKSLKDAKSILVYPAPNEGKAEMCDLVRTQFPGEDVETSFLWQKKRFILDADKKVFREVVFPIDQQPLLKSFQQSHGLQSKSDLEHAERKYGLNRFDIPIPTFQELFKEHAVAPFFVFQLFCVGLWLLDEYWYYSLFTLFMLVVFECTIVFQRQRTLNEFRSMSIKPYDIYVRRENKWVETKTDELIPGDLVSVVRTKDDSGVPCDMVLISGTAVVNEAMLSGESTPLVKESIALRPSNEVIDFEGMDKNAFLWGGTKVLQVTPSVSKAQENVPGALDISGAPDNGALAVVTRTGFETSQGSLVRTMIYSTERVSANNAEALYFILFLLVFAIAASWYVWQEGVKQNRKQSKLMLDCVLIVTSVVPPELPMELSMAVNSSLAALSKYYIYCTEPFRIPFAGRVDVCCFDKTGTLTTEDLVVEGVAGLKVDAPKEMAQVKDATDASTLVLATAHALVKLEDGEIVGDPMEKATLEALDWTLGKNGALVPASTSAHARTQISIRRRFQFSSALKRQSTISSLVLPNGKKSTLISVKGAPETIRKMLVNVPAGYEDTYKHFTRKGSRVLALGYKYTSENLSLDKINGLVREEVEGSLEFAGFLIFHCPLKDDAKDTVKMLNESSHRCVMITGDNPLTAVHVAKEVEIVEREVLILDAPEDPTSAHELEWRTIDEATVIPMKPSDAFDMNLLNSYDLCVTGFALAKFEGRQDIIELIKRTWVWARVSPKQKEFILVSLKEAGYYTLMAGDGTNDVGALKQAHIGVALLNGTEDDLKKIAQHAQTERMKGVYEKQKSISARFNAPPPPVPPALAHLYPPGPQNPHREKALDMAQKTLEKLGETTKGNGVEAPRELTPQEKQAQKSAELANKMFSAMQSMEDMEDDAPTIKLGDASVAAPFTSKLTNVMAIANIIRQGRCTLVATIQMYKILALNCLISAYSLSVLYLDGIKFGDGQVTISGMLMSVCFLCISKAKPVEKLSKERPQPNIFNMYIIGSILLQFAVHVASLIYIDRVVGTYEKKEINVDLEAEFSPSLLNSAIYLIQLSQQVSTFVVNYQGRPFRESIRENRALYWGLLSVSFIAFSCATEFVPEINEKLRLVKFEDAFKMTLTLVMAADFVLCYVIEQVFKALFADNKPKDITLPKSGKRVDVPSQFAKGNLEGKYLEK